jgi:HPt (histidine-containing phosphotransfer) domain-containing protein
MNINQARINELACLLGDGLQNVIQEYLASSQQVIELIQASHEQQDLEAMCHYLHRLKGSSANLGVEYVSDACYALEREIRTNGAVGSIQRVRDIERILKTAWQQLQQD